MMILLQILIFLTGASIVAAILVSAIRTFILPRSARDRLARVVFLAVRWVFDRLADRFPTYTQRDSIMALYAPMSLLVLLLAWLLFIQLGYTGMFWALGVPGWEAAFVTSGSSLLTLGFAPIEGLPRIMLAFSEAAIGLIMVALLIAYLPTIYSGFSRREAAVTLLEVRAGSPPSAIELLLRYHRIHGLRNLTTLWTNWEAWFADLEESHTSLAALTFFRSPRGDRSWVTAAGTVLDAASLTLSVIDLPEFPKGDPQAALCIRAGYLALRHIADFFQIPFNPQPRPIDPITITQAEFDAAYDELAGKGLPMKPNRAQAWLDFKGWRVNYDPVLIALARLTMAPEAPWSSDRVLVQQRRGNS